MKNPDGPQVRYEGNDKNCIYWPIFKGLNDWRIVNIIDKNDDNDGIDYYIMEDNLSNVAFHMSKLAKVNNYGAFLTANNNISSDYYVVRWTTLPYTLQNATSLGMYSPPLMLKAGELVSDAIFFIRYPTLQAMVYS